MMQQRYMLHAAVTLTDTPYNDSVGVAMSLYSSYSSLNRTLSAAVRRPRGRPHRSFTGDDALVRTTSTRRRQSSAHLVVHRLNHLAQLASEVDVDAEVQVSLKTEISHKI